MTFRKLTYFTLVTLVLLGSQLGSVMMAQASYMRILHHHSMVKQESIRSFHNVMTGRVITPQNSSSDDISNACCVMHGDACNFFVISEKDYFLFRREESRAVLFGITRKLSSLFIQPFVRPPLFILT